MRMVDLIEKKRDGKVLSQKEIDWVVENYTNGTIPEYQMSAMAMAIYFKGMSAQEMADLTMAMVNSGDSLDLSAIEGIKVDKHSTGGVGDKTTLVLTPLLAASGVKVAKMSGRGLGHTGGTVDKLESIAGFHTELEPDEFIRQVREIGIAVIGQSGNLTPADKKLYGLRDVTATVDSIPLIASSIMSKKIAAGSDLICLDVKVGSGAFMKTVEDGRRLAENLVAIGNAVNRKTIAFLTNMQEPLGLAVGNSLEVEEAVNTLKGEGPKDLTELCLTMGGHMLVAAGAAPDFQTARVKLEQSLADGSAFEKLCEFIGAQGGDVAMIRDTSLLPHAPHIIPVKSEHDGYIQEITALPIGHAAMLLGAGRSTKEDQLDYAVGIVLDKKVGTHVKAGDVLCYVHSQSTDIPNVIAEIHEAFVIEPQEAVVEPLIYEAIGV